MEAIFLRLVGDGRKGREERGVREINYQKGELEESEEQRENEPEDVTV
jgi:hypothetical protein